MAETTDHLIANNLAQINARIAAASKDAGRDLRSVRLVAVSKTHPRCDVETAYKLGQRNFGENRVQEAKAKFTDLKKAHTDLSLHLIGPLQTNKVEDALRLFDVIETLDRPRLAEECARLINKTGLSPRFFIEINIGNEPQKAGIAPEGVAEFLQFARLQCGLNVTGLMAIPPQEEDALPYFLQLKKLSEQHGLPDLSMGMSGDFETAIRAGSTEIRVGTAIFGGRPRA